MSLRLYLLRHADAGDPMAWTSDDALRPLSAKGRRQAERLARHLVAIGFETDAIISSPKLRARETAEIVADALDLTVRLDERLAEGFDLEIVDAILRDAGGPRRPVLVGHDPDFSDLAAGLSGTATVALKKGALVRIDVEEALAPGGGRLRWLLPPDAIGG
ncbi:MAG TPA: histidine phosphatase family protein [Candidatus Polarisedimenticolia bacterium]|nr:histidine phosphatase family protein [Candidatus Polarisedimenticolia bacterium]